MNAGDLSDEEAGRFANLYRIMKQTRRNKRRGRDAVEYEANFVAKLVRDLRKRDQRTMRIEENYTFLVSFPRWREIFATEFSGRMIDHEVSEVVIPEAEKILSEYTYNNRKNKGSMAAINQLVDHIAEASEGYTKPARIIKTDFSGFFPNALWDYAEKVISKVIDKTALSEEQKAYLRWLTMIAIHCNPTKHCVRRTDRFLWEHINPEKSLFNKKEGIGAAIGRLIWQTAMGLYINDEVK